MNLNEFITKWTGKHVDVDGIYPDQCMDLMHQYLMDVFDFSPDVNAAVGAYDVFTEYKWSNLFERIYNTPDGIPQKGDLIFWDHGVGAWGHVAIFVDGDIDFFNSFDANWPIGSLPHIQSHNYSNAAGWLRPKQQATDDMISIDKAVFEELVTKATAYDKFAKSGYTQIEQVLSEVKQLEQEISDKGKDIDVLKAENAHLKEVIKELQIIKPDPLLEKVRAIMNGSGWWWTKWAKLKALIA